jgi:hypothetical protein
MLHSSGNRAKRKEDDMDERHFGEWLGRLAETLESAGLSDGQLFALRVFLGRRVHAIDQELHLKDFGRAGHGHSPDCDCLIRKDGLFAGCGDADIREWWFGGEYGHE